MPAAAWHGGQVVAGMACVPQASSMPCKKAKEGFLGVWNATKRMAGRHTYRHVLYRGKKASSVCCMVKARGRQFLLWGEGVQPRRKVCPKLSQNKDPCLGSAGEECL